MRRIVATLALAAATALLGGCVYDPYTGGLAPCCTYYGYPYGYRYPAPLRPVRLSAWSLRGAACRFLWHAADWPRWRPGHGTAGHISGSGGQCGPGGSAALPEQGGSLALHFAAANVTNDGRLTRQQAEEGMPLVAQNFDAIDLEGKGYVTLPEIQAFMAQRRAAGGQPIQLDTN